MSQGNTEAKHKSSGKEKKRQLIAVIGDVHHYLWLAVDELSRVEAELGRVIHQVFSVGDLGLFLEVEDWDFLTGPEHFRRPEDTSRVREAWERWRWPLSMIGGNHEPFHRLRDWDPGYYDYRLDYTDAGVMQHGISGLRVYGLTGIQNSRSFALRGRGVPGWEQVLDDIREGNRDIRELTWYRRHDIDELLALPPRPHLLLTHNWPFGPSRVPGEEADRPEWQLLQLLRPQFHFAGYQHQHRVQQIDQTRFEGLNIIPDAGWLRVLEWDGAGLCCVFPGSV